MQNQLEILKQTQYLLFIVKEHKPKTVVVAVVNRRTKEEIGIIRWNSTQYYFYPYHNMKLNNNYLLDITMVLFDLNPIKRKKTVAVVAHNVNDFLFWKRKKGHKSTGVKRRYTTGNNEYVCMTRPQDVHGFSIDKVIETEQAYLNHNIDEIMTQVNICMRPKRQ